MIKNKTRRFIIIESQRTCKSLLCKGTGLMLRKKPNYGLIFPFARPRRISLTMWFVFYPIDVLYLDENKKVVDIIHSFRPFSNYTPKCLASYVIELPVGAIKGTRTGDLISFDL